LTATQWLEVLFSFSVQVVVVVAVCQLLERAMVHSADRTSIWNTCLFFIPLLFVAALVLPRLHLFQPWSQLQPQTVLSVSTAQTVIGKSLLAVWCMGTCVSIIKWIGRAYLVRRLLTRCDELPAREVLRLLQMAKATITRRQILRLLISDEVQGPFCLQLHQPTIVLPRYLLEGSEDDLRHVLIHELEHLKTNHPFQLFLQHLAQVVCWFHPAVWKAAWQASLAREFSCDDAVTAQEANCAAYLRTLLHIAERGEQVQHPSVIAFGRAPSEIVVRAQRLVSAATGTLPQRRFALPGKKSAACILSLVACLMTLVWIPSDPLSSARSVWSPWPTWTAETLHCFGFSLRDYEPFDGRVQLYELQQEIADLERRAKESLVRN
jgi:beta-lactamase regulating signal transducer with metallopeptidase domain